MKLKDFIASLNKYDQEGHIEFMSGVPPNIVLYKPERIEQCHGWPYTPRTTIVELITTSSWTPKTSQKN